MKDYSYGSKGYYKNRVELATTRNELLNEAIAARLVAQSIKADEFSLYAEILKDAENSVNYAKDELAKNEEGEK